MRYMNMHPNANIQQQVQMQQPTQQMPMGGMQPMMQQQQPQMVMMMTPNGPVMVPVMPQGQQQPMMPMQQGGGILQQFPAPNTMNMNNQSVVGTGRFTQGGINPPQFQPQVNDDFNRFQPQQQFQQQEEAVNEVSTKPIPFTVKPTQIKYPNNERVTLSTITNPIKLTDIKHIKGTISADCFEEVVESIIENSYEDENVKPLTVRNFIVSNTFYRADINEIIREFATFDIKTIYKELKHTYRELVSKYQIVAINQFNTILTDLVNDYIAINSENSINIDSFMSDFNDLLKVIRNYEEDLEDNLIDYMNNRIADMKACLDSLSLVNSVGVIPESYNIAYLDKAVSETGLQDIDGIFMNIESNAANSFLISIFNEVTAVIGNTEFILVTMDRSIFKCMMNDNSDYFIKKLV